MREGLSFDDVLLVPQHGVLPSRAEASLDTWLIRGYPLRLPIISANMPTVTGVEMAVEMSRLGGLSFLHRFNTPEEGLAEWLEVNHQWGIAVPSIGLNDWDRWNLLAENGCGIFCLDVAHGDHERVVDFLLDHPGFEYVVGNVATYEGAARLIDAGASGLKVGIGPGAACTTREVTGFGVPQLTAILEVKRAIDYYNPTVTLIADGGIKNSGDIVKALAAGADSVMLGRLLAGADEAPLPGRYAGNASNFVRDDPHHAPEGVVGEIEHTGPVEGTIKQLAWGIRSGISYAGARNLKELRDNVEFIRVSPMAQIETRTRL